MRRASQERGAESALSAILAFGDMEIDAHARKVNVCFAWLLDGNRNVCERAVPE